MKVCFYLTGSQYLTSEANGEETQRILSAYDNRDCDRIQIKEGTNIFHIAKSHIVAIHIIQKTETKQKLN